MAPIALLLVLPGRTGPWLVYSHRSVVTRQFFIHSLTHSFIYSFIAHISLEFSYTLAPMQWCASNPTFKNTKFTAFANLTWYKLANFKLSTFETLTGKTDLRGRYYYSIFKVKKWKRWRDSSKATQPGSVEVEMQTAGA